MRAVAIVSGGMDSATMLYQLRDDGIIVEAIGIDYGQRHSKELFYAATLCEGLKVPFICVHAGAIGRVIRADSSLLNPDVSVPDGHYADETMKATVVPNRNMLLLSVAIGRALATGAEAVAYGAHSGDHTIYPDCRPTFFTAMQEAAKLCDWRPVLLLAPFMHMTKSEIVRIGAGLGVPYERTWSCYKGKQSHCGMCGTCVERREAFELAGVPDPTRYQEAA